MMARVRPGRLPREKSSNLSGRRLSPTTPRRTRRVPGGSAWRSSRKTHPIPSRRPPSPWGLGAPERRPGRSDPALQRLHHRRPSTNRLSDQPFSGTSCRRRLLRSHQTTPGSRTAGPDKSTGPVPPGRSSSEEGDECRGDTNTPRFSGPQPCGCPDLAGLRKGSLSG